MTTPSTAQDRERVVPRLLRAASGVLVLALTGGALAGAVRAGEASPLGVPAAQVEVEPTPVSASCAGPVLLPQRAARGDAAFDPAPVAPEVTLDAVAAAGAGASTVLALGGEQVGPELEAGGGATHLEDVAAPLVVRTQPQDAPPVAAGTSASVVTDGDARGLAAASCRSASNDDWFVGGSTAVGATASLVLTNPGLTAARVQVALYGPNGRVEPTTGQHVVAPGATRTVDLGGAAADQASLVVHVTTSGGLVVAHVQDTAVRGFTPAGTDLVVPGLAPATRQVLTGLVVPASEVGSADAPVLRLLAPGDAPATAGVTLLGADGPVDLPGAQRVALGAQEVTELPLGGLPAGAYTVVVDADQPVVAGAVTSVVGEPGGLDDEPRVERAWSPTTRPGTHGLVALPRGAAARVVVGAVGRDVSDAGRGTATLRVLGRDGTPLSEHDVSVDAGTTGAWDVADLAPDAAAVELEPRGGTPLVWAVALSVDQVDGPLVAMLDPVPVVGEAPALAVRENPGTARG